jgi:hypothetical protein
LELPPHQASPSRNRILGGEYIFRASGSGGSAVNKAEIEQDERLEAAAAGSAAEANSSVETGRRRTPHCAQSFYRRRPGVHAAHDGLEEAAAASAATYADCSGFAAVQRTGMGMYESTQQRW